MAAESIVAAIVQNVSALLPFRMINDTQRGVRWTMGRNRREVGPGLVWFAPLLQRVLVVESAQAVTETQTISATTSDGKPVAVSVGVRWQVEDACAWHGLQFQENAISNLAEAALSDAVGRHTLEHLMAKHREVEASIEGSMRWRCADWGIRLHDVRFVNRTTARAFRLFMHGSASAAPSAAS